VLFSLHREITSLTGECEITTRVSTQDAIEVYAFALAYLHDARYDTAAVANSTRVKQMAPGVFYFWRRERRTHNSGHTAPLAVCTYNKAAKTCRIEFLTGETLTLVDKVSVWEVLERKLT
jgi:hypothetical protein